MPWSDAQKKAVFEAFWSRATPRCPVCQAVLSPTVTPTDPDYSLTASCSRGCGELRMSRNDDPKKAKFRSWTKDEQTRIMDAHFDDDPVVCPVDGSEVTVTESPGKTGNRVVASCMRCGANFQA